MVSNLLLLPSLLLSLEQSIANKKVFKEPAIKILPKEEEELNQEMKDQELAENK